MSKNQNAKAPPVDETDEITREDVGTNVVALAQTPGGVAPSFVKGAGRGTSQKAEDNIVPMLAVLQPLSPQVQEDQPSYIQGAKPGMIWLKTAPTPLLTEILFQPCYFDRKQVEWKPRDQGGGFVARHDEMPGDAVPVKDQKNPEKIRWMRPRGTEIIDTRYHAGHVVFPNGLMMPYLIPLSSTGHTVSRTWQTHMNNFRTAEGEIADSFGRLYRLTTRRRQNAAGSWFILEPMPDRDATEIEYRRGLALFESLVAGETQFGAEDTNDEHLAQAQAADVHQGEKAPF
jgi:hypothetical protein